MSYTKTHFDDAVTLRGIADNLLTMRWIDMVAFCNGLNGERARHLTPSNIHEWAINHIAFCEKQDEARKQKQEADDAAKEVAKAAKENAAIMKGAKK